MDGSALRGSRCARAVGLVVLFGGFFAHDLARAQVGPPPQTNNLEIEHFAPQLFGFATLDRTRSLRWGEFALGLVANYSDSPLVLFRDRLQVGEVVKRRLSADLVVHLGLFSWLELSAALPATFHQTGDDGILPSSIDSVGFRDIRVRPKLTIGTQDQTGFVGIALVPGFTLPVGDDQSFLGDGGVTFSPELVVDRSFSVLWGIRFGLGAGVKIRPDAEIGNIRVTDELFYRAGVGVGLPPLIGRELEGVAEVFGATRLASPFGDRAQDPLIWRVGGRATFLVSPGHEVLASTGVGFGATRGYGAPDVHAWLGIAYSRVRSDRDGDGIVDDSDACPDDPEDRDGFEDSDGCPDPDNDRDGLPDTADRCPDDPEDFDGFRDQDGCPDPDNDEDGYLDGEDGCPNEPEDFDGFEDEDGCPDPDNDKDGVPDTEDRCPTEKETINGIDDEDGCPDEGEPNVEITAKKVTINERVMFDFDSDRLRPESFSILNQVALTLQANLELTRIRVEGHTDSRGTDDYNLDLSQRRAESVVRYLVSKRVDRARLEPVGYGESQPVVAEENEEAWRQNRRVEFTILDQELPIEPPEGREMTIPDPEAGEGPEAPEGGGEGETPPENAEETAPSPAPATGGRKITIPPPD